MFQITQYANAEKPQVLKTTDLEKVLKIIKDGDDRLPLIHWVRTKEKGSEEYDEFKKKNFPTFRFNFLFKDYAKNSNITGPTGLIYLDADNLDEVPKSPYVLAAWKSLSNTGFGILAKVDNLTMDNYKHVYNQLSELIGITSDAGARKSSQQTIQSYDPDLYYNPDSLTFHFTENEKVSCTPILEKGEKCIGTNDTLNNGSEESIRFNNIGDYFTGEYAIYDYRVFNEKIRICNPFIPMMIEEGKRNSTMFFLLSQYALLNLKTGKSFLKSIGETINKHMYPSLSEREVINIVESVLKKREEGSLTIFYNQERRFLFNPAVALNRNEKMIIVNRESGKLKSDFTKELMYLTLQDWDFETSGIITQKKVSLKVDRGTATVKRYWKEFKDYVLTLNNDFKQKQIEPMTSTKPQRGITIDKYIFNMRCKFTSMEPSDERFLCQTFKKRDITHVTDNGFDEIHQWICKLLKSRQELYKAA